MNTITPSPGWNARKVRYEQIHTAGPQEFAKLMDALELGSGQRVGDFMAGYGAVSREVCDHARTHALTGLELVLLDRYHEQLRRSHDELTPAIVGSAQVARVLDDIRKPSFADRSFDRIAIKMGLHELPQPSQQAALDQVYRLLKPGGILAVWDVMPQTLEEQQLFQKLIRKKDELAGYQSLAQDRYFFRQDELEAKLSQAGFAGIEFCHAIPYRLETCKRLGPEFGGDERKLNAWNEHIRGIVPEALKPRLAYEDKCDTIELTFRKGIVRARKPYEPLRTA